jgi:hypothetical protein
VSFIPQARAASSALAEAAAMRGARLQHRGEKEKLFAIRGRFRRGKSANSLCSRRFHPSRRPKTPPAIKCFTTEPGL